MEILLSPLMFHCRFTGDSSQAAADESGRATGLPPKGIICYILILSGNFLEFLWS